MQNKKSVPQQGQTLAAKAGEFLIGNDLRVTRLGFRRDANHGRWNLGRTRRSG